jgi:ABC-type uncharacterized transport system ATPase subunit
MLRAVPDELARAASVEKRFGDLVAVRAATCSFRAGEIHAVCGENGAGKSTLLKMVAGMLVPDAGHVEAFGSLLSPHTPREAIRRGVGMVLQHFALVPVFTALENVVLGAEPVRQLGVLDMDAARGKAERVAKDLGVDIPWDARVETLGIGDRQRLEIARALFRDASLLVLDEPTAVLTKGEVSALYATLQRLKEAGKGVVVITHKMDEVRNHADVVTVMRKGELVFTRPIDRAGDVRAQVDDVAAAIMGAVHGQRTDRAEIERAEEGEVLLDVRDVRLGRGLAGVSLNVRAGEIVGVAGVEGNGQTELVAILAGDVAPDAGEVRGIDPGAPAAVIREDRQTEGLVLEASVRDNLLLGELGSFRRRLGLLNMSALEAEAKRRVLRSGAPADLDRPAGTLSGGNQQKVVVARALSRVAERRVVVAAQPTRGVDLAATRDIHDRLREAAGSGAAVLVLSADLDELRALCTRILVLARGRIVAEMTPEASDEEIGRRMLGMEASA